jgi:hypothetical protein
MVGAMDGIGILRPFLVRAVARVVWCCCLSLLPMLSRANWVIDYPVYPQPVFGGGERKIEIHVSNPVDMEMDREVRYQMIDADSTNRTVVMEGAWKRLRVLPYQRVIEFVTIRIPDVEKPATRILTFTDGQFSLGSIALCVYPTNMMKSRLKDLVGDGPIGMLDGELLCQPVCDKEGIGITNIQRSGLAAYSGKLVIVTGEPSDADIARFPETAARGVGVVWVQPNFFHWMQTTKPSYYFVSQGRCAVVVVQRSFIAELATNPYHQLRLLECCRLAIKPQPLELPDLKSRFR